MLTCTCSFVIQLSYPSLVVCLPAILDHLNCLRRTIELFTCPQRLYTNDLHEIDAEPIEIAFENAPPCTF